MTSCARMHARMHQGAKAPHEHRREQVRACMHVQYACMRLYSYACTDARMRVCMQGLRSSAHIFIRSRMRQHVVRRVCARLHRCVDAWMRACAQICSEKRMDALMRMSAHACMRTFPTIYESAHAQPRANSPQRCCLASPAVSVPRFPRCISASLPRFLKASLCRCVAALRRRYMHARARTGSFELVWNG
jgi:hypothetical protein